MILLVGSNPDPFAPVKVPDPFAPVPQESTLAVLGDRTFQEVKENGHIIEYKMESGVRVKLKDHGHIKDKFNNAIWNAALKPVNQELTEEEKSAITNVDAAALMLARRAAIGDMDAINALFDRVLGKPKQTTESLNVELNIDAILTGQDDSGPVIEVKPG